MAKFSVIGKSVLRVDGLEKVTGKAKFCSDFKIPEMLYGRALRSPYPHARIRSILPANRRVTPANDFHEGIQSYS